jgi:ribosomal protein S18 acetylase RimI-like enzyme
MYSQYVMERTNDLVLETESGFATYRYVNDGKTVYIVDIYVVPDFRQTKAATLMADEIVNEAKARGCKDLIGTVVPSTKNSTLSLKVLLGYGMTLNSAANDVVVFRKEI